MRKAEKVGVLYRGSPYPEDAPGPRDFAGVFFSEDPVQAAQYGIYLQSYEANPQRLLDIEMTEAAEIFREFSGDYDEDSMVEAFMFPDEAWVKVLQKNGYTGTRIGKDVFLAWPFKITLVGRKEMDRGPQLGDNRGIMDGLNVRWEPPAPGRTGFVVVEQEDGSGMEAYFGSAADVARGWLDWRDSETARCVAEAGGNAAWLESFSVVPERRGRGIGTRILRTLLGMLRKFGVNRAWGYAAPEDDEWMDPLLRLYDRHGFSIISGCGGRGNLIMLDLSA